MVLNKKQTKQVAGYPRVVTLKKNSMYNSALERISLYKYVIRIIKTALR